MSISKNTGPLWYAILFFILFFGLFALVVKLSFAGLAPKYGLSVIGGMLAVSPLLWKFLAPKIPNKSLLLGAVFFIVAEAIAHFIGEYFPPAYFISHIALDLVVGGWFFSDWKGYL